MLLLEAVKEAVQLRLVLSGEEGQYLALPVEQPPGDRGGDLLEVVRARDRNAVGKPEPGALAHVHAVQLDVTRGARHLARRDLLDRSSIAAAFSAASSDGR